MDIKIEIKFFLIRFLKNERSELGLIAMTIEYSIKYFLVNIPYSKWMFFKKRELKVGGVELKTSQNI